MDINKIQKLDGKFIESSEVSTSELESVKIDAQHNIDLINEDKQRVIDKANDRVLYWKGVIQKIDNLLQES